MTKPSSPNTKRRTRATTTKKKTSPVAKKPTNKKQSSGKKKDVLNLKYWAFEMKGTGKEEYFDDIQEAKEFQISFGDIIEKTRKFSTKPQWVARKKEFLTLKKAVPHTPVMRGINKTEQNKISPKDRAKQQKVIDLIAMDRPSNTFHVYVKSTPRSKLAVAIIEFIDKNGDPIWCVKGQHQCISLKNFGKIFKQESKQIQQALTNLEYGKTRDPTGDPYTPKVNIWTSPGKETRQYDLFTMYTFFEIPVNILTSFDDEAQFLKDMGKEIGEQFKGIMLSDIYGTCLEQAINSPGMWSSMNKPRNGPNWREYVQSCVVKVHDCSNVNTHLVLDDSNSIITKLYESNMPKRKYGKLLKKNSKGDSDDEESANDNEPGDPEEDSDGDSDGEKIEPVIKEATGKNDSGIEGGDSGIEGGDNGQQRDENMEE